MYFEKFEKEWKKGNFALSYLVVGEEDFLKSQFLQLIQKNALETGAEDFNLDLFYASDTDGAKIVNAAASFPVLAPRRLVIVKEFDLLPARDLKLLANYLKKPSPSTCLVLTADKIDSRKSQFSLIKSASTVIEAKPLYDNQISDWLKSYLAELGLEISGEALRLLHASTGNSLRAISTEIEKIKLNLGKRAQISVDDIENVVGISKQFSIFEFCDSVGKKNIKESLSILNQMFQLGEQPGSIMNMLTRHFLILSKIKILKAQKKSDNEIAGSVKINPFFIKNYLHQAQLFSSKQLEDIFSILLETDLALKTSYQKPKIALETLLFKIRLI